MPATTPPGVVNSLWGGEKASLTSRAFLWFFLKVFLDSEAVSDFQSHQHKPATSHSIHLKKGERESVRV